MHAEKNRHAFNMVAMYSSSLAQRPGSQQLGCAQTAITKQGINVTRRAGISIFFEQKQRCDMYQETTERISVGKGRPTGSPNSATTKKSASLVDRMVAHYWKCCKVLQVLHGEARSLLYRRLLEMPRADTPRVSKAFTQCCGTHVERVPLLCRHVRHPGGACT